jgi:hypothetical protein
MTWVKSFLESLQVVAKSPYAFVAYVCLLAGFIYWLVSQLRLNAIAQLPARERAAVLTKEYNVFPKSGLSGEEWIRSRRQTLTFWAFVVLIVAVVLLGTVALLKVNPAAPTVSTTGNTTANDAANAKTAATPVTPGATAATDVGGTAKSAISPSTAHGPNQPVAAPPLDIPPIVHGGAPIGTKFQNRYLKNNVECVAETVKVSAEEWQERNSSGNPASCDVGAVIFTFTERESNDPHYFLLYDEGRNVLARVPNIPVAETGPSEWRQPPSQTWNEQHSLTRIN